MRNADPRPAGEFAPATYERIVVPLDGSDLAEQALPHALTLARALTIPLHLVRVVDTSTISFIGPGMAIEQASFAALLEAIASEEHDAADYLAAVSQRLASSGVVISTKVRGGPVVDEVLATLRPGDLLVMTTHGRTGLARWFLGSVAEAVIRRATTPVLLIRSGQASHGSAGQRASSAETLQQATPPEIPDTHDDKQELSEHKHRPAP